ncbi:NAD(P)/FAD-dependent oxidoreductase [Kitasatospora sp. NBC_01302]|uniref:NAD(P)/FAD-dependent oxidoreductase n=1 Tax=Kitasatospora sp. NBC_01302 TaxID=2903575 RepID=UPI002E102002|nr:FAD-dependent oxidoreductase [Kitasatospora sp. NBC_01302]
MGGGCAGLATAQRLQRELQSELRAGRAEVTVVEAAPYLTYRPLLAEVAAGSIDPRHVVVPLRQALPDCRVLTGRVARIDHARRLAWLTPKDGVESELAYDELVLAAGSTERGAPVPGLAEHGLRFGTVGEAVALGRHVRDQLDLASTTRDPELRDAALTFVFVGAGYGGVGALAELEDMARRSLRGYPNIAPADLRWVLVEPGERILAEAEPELAEQALSHLRERNVDVRLKTALDSARDHAVALSDGTRLAARTLVWTAGERPAPVLGATDLPTGEDGRIRCLDTLQVLGPDGRALPGAWAAGDCAAVPLGPELCGRDARHALTQGGLLAENLLAVAAARPPRGYRPDPRHVADPLGLRLVAGPARKGLSGRRAWLLQRTRTLRGLPSNQGRVRVLADWVLGGGRDH